MIKKSICKNELKNKQLNTMQAHLHQNKLIIHSVHNVIYCMHICWWKLTLATAVIIGAQFIMPYALDRKY